MAVHDGSEEEGVFVRRRALRYVLRTILDISHARHIIDQDLGTCGFDVVVHRLMMKLRHLVLRREVHMDDILLPRGLWRSMIAILPANS